MWSSSLIHHNVCRHCNDEMKNLPVNNGHSSFCCFLRPMSLSSLQYYITTSVFCNINICCFITVDGILSVWLNILFSITRHQLEDNKTDSSCSSAHPTFHCTSNYNKSVHRHGDDFSVGGAKIGEKLSRQSNSKYNFMRYVFFGKGISSVEGLQLRVVSNPQWGETRLWCCSRSLSGSDGLAHGADSTWRHGRHHHW